MNLGEAKKKIKALRDTAIALNKKAKWFDLGDATPAIIDLNIVLAILDQVEGD